MTRANFFGESRPSSRIKSMIVFKYFKAWASVIRSVQKKNRSEDRIAYIDLFAGQGVYDDGTVSTPILILEEAIKNPDFKQHLLTRFNDKEVTYAEALRHSIEILPGVDSLKYEPEVSDEEVGQEMIDQLSSTALIPSLLFADPWGYKGLSLDLIHSVIKDWGCDCIFFFNYNRINAALTKPKVKELVDDLFEESRADELRAEVPKLSPLERERVVLTALGEALRELGADYVLPFKFRNRKSSQNSHYLVFVSKDFKGYHLMKNIMAKASTESSQDVPSFEYDPWLASLYPELLQLELEHPMDDLKAMLLESFAGQTVSMEDIYRQHSVNRKYIERNYKDALIALENEGRIDASKHKKGTFASHVLATFPLKSG